MSKIIRVLAAMMIVGAAFVFGSPGEVYAGDDDWNGDYYDNMDLEGKPDEERNDDEIDFNWGKDRPISGIPKDEFSVEWKRTVKFNKEGTYRFKATFDDGMRVYLDDDLIIDEWEDGEKRTVEKDVFIEKGEKIKIRVEYYDYEEKAIAKFDWERESSEDTTGGGASGSPDESAIYPNWKGQYYNNRDLSGTPALQRNDTAVNFSWGYGAPASGINSDNFSVRWTATVNFGEGTYRFTATSDDGMRVWLDNDQLILDQWFDHGTRTISADKFMSGGEHNIRIEYYDNVQGATAKFSWAAVSATAPPPAAPTTTTTTTTAPSPGGTYTVVGGDSLTKIAASNGTTVSALVSLNNSTYPSLTSNPNVIYPGWVLVLPDGQGGGGYTGDTYTVRPGDYLIRIAGITGVPVSTIVNLNSGTYPSLLTNPNIIYTGWVFRLS